jgi:hypothetical protein
LIGSERDGQDHHWSSFIFRAVQTGLWQNYALLFAVGLFLILLLFIYPAILTTIKSFRRQ